MGHLVTHQAAGSSTSSSDAGLGREVMSHASAGLGMEGGHKSCGCRAGDGGRS